ncbi:hypothetical protein JTB14_023256 [Gonioctena quinquepunctata]|nr:hypothetical protein JTB14_023256 [Gonioctena quinquepunctata]
MFTALSAHVKSTGNDWFLDSGCSAHLTVYKSNFISEETSSKLTITTANDQQMETNCVGVTCKQQVFPNNIFEEETELEDHHRPTHDEYVSYSSFVENFNNPTSVEEVLASPDKENWLKAMDRGYKAQIDNGTWELVDLPTD